MLQPMLGDHCTERPRGVSISGDWLLGLIRIWCLMNRAMLLRIALFAGLPAHAAIGQETRTSPFYAGPIDTAAARQMAGCYTVVVGPWSEPRANGGYIPVPLRVTLDTMRTGTTGSGGMVLRAEPLDNERFGHEWKPVGGDSVQLGVWADGFSSVYLFLRPQANRSLRGTARYFTDARLIDRTGRWAWEVYPTAPARLSRVPCK
jgi:hypothetical protein